MNVGIIIIILILAFGIYLTAKDERGSSKIIFIIFGAILGIIWLVKNIN